MKLNRTFSLTTLSAITLALLSGCGSHSNSGDSTDDYATGAPELAAVQMRLTGDESTEAVATDEDSIDPTTGALTQVSASPSFPTNASVVSIP